MYSFGVVLLELLCGKRPNDDFFGENKGIVKWVSGIAISSMQQRDENFDLNQIVDPRMNQSTCDYEQMKNVFDVALLCTSEFPNHRPSMRKVVELLKRNPESRSFSDR